MANHYSKEDLELYRNYQMSILGRLTRQAHFMECPGCAHLMKELSKDDDFIRLLRSNAEKYEVIVSNGSMNKKHTSVCLPITTWRFP